MEEPQQDLNFKAIHRISLHKVWFPVKNERRGIVDPDHFWRDDLLRKMGDQHLPVHVSFNTTSEVIKFKPDRGN